MPVVAKNAGSWKTAKAVFAKHASTWKLCVGVWSRASGVWSRLGGTLTGASAGGGGLGECYWFPPDTICTATVYVTAYPISGWPPFTYQWYKSSSTSNVFLNNATSQSCYLSGNMNGADFRRITGTGTVYCVVTDSTGATATTNSVTVEMIGHDGNI